MNVTSLLSGLTSLAVLKTFCLLNHLINRTSYRGAFAPKNILMNIQKIYVSKACDPKIFEGKTFIPLYCS